MVRVENRKRKLWLGGFEIPQTNGSQSGMELPHFKTVTRIAKRRHFREILECGSPMPLLPLQSAVAFPFSGLMLLLLGLRFS